MLYSFFDLYTGFTRVGHFLRLTCFLSGTRKSFETILIYIPSVSRTAWVALRAHGTQEGSGANFTTWANLISPLLSWSMSCVGSSLSEPLIVRHPWKRIRGEAYSDNEAEKPLQQRHLCITWERNPLPIKEFINRWMKSLPLSRVCCHLLWYEACVNQCLFFRQTRFKAREMHETWVPSRSYELTYPQKVVRGFCKYIC